MAKERKLRREGRGKEVEDREGAGGNRRGSSRVKYDRDSGWFNRLPKH